MARGTKAKSNSNELPFADHVEKAASESTELFIQWLKDNTGYEVDETSIRLARALVGHFQKSDENQERLEASRAAKEAAKEERAAKKTQRENAKAEKAAAKKPAAKKSAPARRGRAKASDNGESAPAKPAKKTAAKKTAASPTARRRRRPAAAE